MPRRSLYLILATAIISYVCYQRADRNPYGRYFAEVLQHVDRSYVERVDEQKLFEGAVEGMLSRLDDYSAFIPRTEAQHFQEQLDQEFGGIGLELGVDGKSRQIMVVSPLVGTPAYKAGIRAAGSVMQRGVEVLSGPVLHLQRIARTEAKRIESQLAQALADAGIKVEGGH